ncbi:hypothetical protein SK128_004376 [Halocaridina rubra]|uniref:Uncharacterized protein n=1 Tax=Halocaridina rubra TaxID=373956 RepID=A0AAN8WBX7_HALRR
MLLKHSDSDTKWMTTGKRPFFLCFITRGRSVFERASREATTLVRAHRGAFERASSLNPPAQTCLYPPPFNWELIVTHKMWLQRARLGTFG